MARYPDQLLKLNNLALSLPSWLSSLYDGPETPQQIIQETLVDLTEPAIEHFVRNPKQSIELEPLIPATLLAIGYLTQSDDWQWELSSHAHAPSPLSSLANTETLSAAQAAYIPKLKEGRKYARAVFLYALPATAIKPACSWAVGSHELRDQVGIYRA